MNNKFHPLETVVNFNEDFVADVSSNDEHTDRSHINRLHEFTHQAELIRYSPDVITMIKEKASASDQGSSRRPNKKSSKSRTAQAKFRDTTPIPGRTESSTNSSPEVERKHDEEFLLEDTHSLDSGLDDLSLAEEQRLRLRNVRLEGQLSVVGNEAKTWLTERGNLSAEVAALNGQLKSAKNACEESLKELNNSRAEYEKQLKQLQESLGFRNKDVERLNAELAETRGELIQLKLALDKKGHSTATLNQVKNKVNELVDEIDFLKTSETKLKDENLDLSEQVTSLRDTRDWYQDQLTKSNAIQDKMKTEFKLVMDKLREGSALNHSLSHENVCLQSQLVCAKASLSEAKRNMSHQLDAIRAEMIQREAMFEQLKQEREQFIQVGAANRAELDDTLAKMANLTARGLNLEQQLDEANLAQEEVTQQFNQLKLVKEQLGEQVIELQDQLAEQCTLVVEHKQAHDDLLVQFDNLQVKTAEHESIKQTLDQALAEKTRLEEALEGANQQLANSTGELEKIQAELQSRVAHLDRLKEMSVELTDQNEQLTKQLVDKSACLDAILSEKQALDEALIELQEENRLLQDKLQLMKEESSRVQEEMRNQFEQEVSQLKGCLDHEKKEIQTHLSHIDSLNQELAGLCDKAKKYDQLLTEHLSLKHDHDALLAEIAQVTESANKVRVDLESRLEHLEKGHLTELREKQDQLESLQVEKDQLTLHIAQLTEEIRSKKASLEEETAEWAEKLADSEQQLTASESRRIQLEEELHETRRVQEELALKYAKQVELEQAASIEQLKDAQEKHDKMMKEAELVRGKHSGLKSAYQTLKSHTDSIEARLQEKETLLAELESRAQFKELIYPQQESLITPTMVPLVQSGQEVSKKEREQLAFAASEATKEACEAEANLELAKMDLKRATQSLEQQSATLERDRELKQKLEQELTSERKELSNLRTELIQLNDKLASTNHLNQELERRVESYHVDYLKELETLKGVIKVTSEHVTKLNHELDQTGAEKRLLQSQLEHIKGTLMGLLERFARPGEEMMLVPVDELRALVGEPREAHYMTDSRPLALVNEYLSSLKGELNNLESQIVEHTVTVHDSVDFWKNLHEEMKFCSTLMSSK